MRSYVTGKSRQSTAVGRCCVWLGAAALAVMACDRPDYTYSPDVPVNGTGAIGAFPSDGGSNFAGSFGIAGSAAGGSTSTMTCELDTPNGSPLLVKQTVSNQLPARPSVYLQLTDAEVVALKASSSLLPPAPTPTTPSQLDRLLSQLLTTSSELRKPLVSELITRFKVTRPAWPNPWALRLVDHAGTEHMNPVRITFKPEAWIARIVDGSLAVVDVNNAVVSITSAVSEPERIAAIFYVVDDTTPAVATCDTGKRELLIGNESMVAEFSFGSTEVTQRLDSDIQALQSLLDVTRPCFGDDKAGSSFHSFTLCETWDFFDASSNYQAYQWSLANPVESYRPTAQNLASLILALQSDRLTGGEPFVGTPLGAAGAGGDGAGGESPTDGGADAGGAAWGGAPN